MERESRATEGFEEMRRWYLGRLYDVAELMTPAQLFDFTRRSYLGALDALTSVHEQTAGVLKLAVDQAVTAQQEGWKILAEWQKASKKGTEEYQRVVEENFKKFEKFFENNGWTAEDVARRDIKAGSDQREPVVAGARRK